MAVLTPADNDEVAPTDTLTLSFNVNVRVSSTGGSIVVYDTLSDILHANVSVPSPQVNIITTNGVSGRVVEVTIPALGAGRTYYATVSSGAFETYASQVRPNTANLGAEATAELEWGVRHHAVEFPDQWHGHDHSVKPIAAAGREHYVGLQARDLQPAHQHDLRRQHAGTARPPPLWWCP